MFSFLFYNTENSEWLPSGEDENRCPRTIEETKSQMDILLRPGIASAAKED